MSHNKSISRPVEIGLRLTGIWPGSSYEIIVRVTWIILMTVVQIFQYRYIIKHLDGSNLANLIDSVGTTLPYSLLYVKLIIFWTKRGIFENMLVGMSNDWSNSSSTKFDINAMISKAELAYRYSKVIMSTYAIAVFAYTSVFFEFMRHDNDGEYDLKSRELLMKMDLPFAYYKTPTYQWVFVVQFLQLLINASAIGMLDALIITLIFHIGGQIEMLQKALTNISIKDEKHRLSRNTTKSLIHRHHRIIINSDSIESLFSYIALMQWLCNTLVICCIGFLIVIAFNTDGNIKTFIKTLLFYIAITMEAFIFSFAGEYLSNKSLSISNAAYSSPWYLLDPQDRHIIILLMIRSQRRLTITAGKFMDLSLEGFANILKASASYISVLYAMY
ncbi:PREDICTED: putative odorant receptor 71a [Habropoda laboriosa]|uniref:putative odorant receptor 71a n=1 Tax=Habropoda laboriosa TaxID=597456 RepID=UPI00083DD09A|nr:PREDICTED: putative odorant receptor 71a [Habropoda laboriosa]